MPKIRIVSTPRGVTPHVRRAQLVGVEFVLSAEQKEPERVFNVTRLDAISAMRQKSAELAEWWDMYLQGNGISLLGFARDICDLIEDEPAVSKRPVPAMTARNWGP